MSAKLVPTMNPFQKFDQKKAMLSAKGATEPSTEPSPKLLSTFLSVSGDGILSSSKISDDIIMFVNEQLQAAESEIICRYGYRIEPPSKSFAAYRQWYADSNYARGKLIASMATRIDEFELLESLDELRELIYEHVYVRELLLGEILDNL